MSGIRPVTHTRHANMRWRYQGNYSFTAAQTFVPITLSEVAKAALAFPLALIERDGSWTLAAVLGLKPGQNLYLASTGQWTGSYIPALFRPYPFRMGKTQEGQRILCIDEVSGLVSDSHSGEPFFDETGEPSAAIKQVWGFLQETANSEALLAIACDRLQNAGVIEPWPIATESETGMQQVTGLHRVNETALNALDDTAFDQLRRTGTIGIAYAQLLSMANLSNLAKLAQARAQAEAAEQARAGVKPMVMLPEDNTIDWDWSKIGR